MSSVAPDSSGTSTASVRCALRRNEGTFTAGGGARVWVTPRVYVGGEARFGWELHTRLGGTVGIQLGG